MYKCKLRKWYAQNNLLYYPMGTLESKVKEGYSIRQRPFFKAKQKCGTRPISISQSKNLFSTSAIYRNGEPKLSQGPVAYSTRSDETQNSPTDTQIQNNPFAYPCTAIGVITCIMRGSLKRSTGSLISSNIVLTAAHNLFCFETQVEIGKASFRINYGPEECEQYYIDKILISDQFKNGLQNRMDPKDLYMHDYGILVLGTHVNVEKYGTLGFDFSSGASQGCQNFAIYGYHKRNGTLEIDGCRIKASVGQSIIRYSCVTSFDTTGGPIVQFKDQNYTIIGIQNSAYRQQHQNEKRALKLTSEMFDHLSQWITHEQEEIDIRDKQLGKEGIKKLIKLNWTSLSSINLARNNLGKQGLKYLKRCQWSNLHHLDIGGNDISKEGVRYLVEISMKNLLSLNMWGNGIEAEGALTLLNGNWRRLNNINLYNNDLDNDGVRHLINASWDEMQNINLGKNRIGDAGIRLLLYSSWKNIVSLNLWGNIIKDPKTISSELKKHLYKLKFLYL